MFLLFFLSGAKSGSRSVLKNLLIANVNRKVLGEINGKTLNEISRNLAKTKNKR